jgi:FMN phosphatase YigB (HAD superfamily)
MTFSLLLDLDDTLLDTNLDTFLPVYFKKLAAHMASYVEPEKFIRAMLHNTQIMYANIRSDQTLEQVFSADFYPNIGFEQAALAKPIDQFYDDVYPTLKSLTTPRPEAVELVEWAFSKGWNVAIATDPLFPRKANLHRLRWAGLDPERYPFTLISDFQSFHFAKVSVAFYPEFLARMGWTDGPMLMVGDSLERDILPAKKAGVPAFWLSDDKLESKNDIQQGSFGELMKFLESTDLSTLKVNYGSPQALIAFLQATPAILHTLLLSTPHEKWTKNPGEGEWSLLELFCHFRDVDLEVNLARMELMLREENVFINGRTTDQWALERHYSLQDPCMAFNNFVSTRTKLIDILSGIQPSDWDRRARHTFLGPTALRELVEIMVDHDRLHLKQAYEAVR